VQRAMREKQLKCFSEALGVYLTLSLQFVSSESKGVIPIRRCLSLICGFRSNSSMYFPMIHILEQGQSEESKGN
jgi:hypothetical protein